MMRATVGSPTSRLVFSATRRILKRFFSQVILEFALYSETVEFNSPALQDNTKLQLAVCAVRSVNVSRSSENCDTLFVSAIFPSNSTVSMKWRIQWSPTSGHAPANKSRSPNYRRRRPGRPSQAQKALPKRKLADHDHPVKLVRPGT